MLRYSGTEVRQIESPLSVNSGLFHRAPQRLLSTEPVVSGQAFGIFANLGEVTLK